MTARDRTNPETQFNRGSWLTLVFSIALLVYGLAALAYQFTLPTDGWQVNEATEVGFNYTENLMGFPSDLQPGDNVVAVEGNPVDFLNISPSLRDAWQAGATLDYTVIRDRQVLHVPVTLAHWQFGKWLLATLSDPYKLAGMLSGYFLLALAFFVFLRRPGNPTAGAFLLLFATLISTDLAPLPVGLPEWIDPLARVAIGPNANMIFFAILLPFALIRFALVFPHPKPILQRHPWLAFVPIAVGFLLNVLAPYTHLGWFWFLISLGLTVAIIVHNSITMRDAVSRAQILWGLGGIIFGFGLLTLLLLATTFGVIARDEYTASLISAIAFIVMGVCLVIAILRYRLWDIDVVIRRTLLYSIITVTLALIYFGLVTVLQSLFSSLTQQQSTIAIVLSTLAIAALFNPLRRWVQDFIDRRFYRKKYDAEKTLAAFAAVARSETDLEALSVELLRVVQETMQPEKITLWLKPQPRPDSK